MEQEMICIVVNLSLQKSIKTKILRTETTNIKKILNCSKKKG
jgi:hypothetical protein